MRKSARNNSAIDVQKEFAVNVGNAETELLFLAFEFFIRKEFYFFMRYYAKTNIKKKGEDVDV